MTTWVTPTLLCIHRLPIKSYLPDASVVPKPTTLSISPPTNVSHKMVKATLNGVVIAESSQPTSLEGNYYFPPDSVKQDVLVQSPTQ